MSVSNSNLSEVRCVSVGRWSNWAPQSTNVGPRRHRYLSYAAVVLGGGGLDGNNCDWYRSTGKTTITAACALDPVDLPAMLTPARTASFPQLMACARPSDPLGALAALCP